MMRPRQRGASFFFTSGYWMVARLANRCRNTRQIVRSELAARPDLVATVAQEALDTLLMSARQITVRVHPDDHALVEQGAADALAQRGARLLADPTITRGGCLVESDIGVVDAAIATRWRRAVAVLGCEAPWEDES